MRVSTIALICAILCFVATFIIVPVLSLLGLPHPGFIVPTLAGLVLLLTWARAMAGGR